MIIPAIVPVVIIRIAITLPVAEFNIDHSDLPLTLLFQGADLSLFFKPVHVETPSYHLNFIIKILVDPGDLHISFSFIKGSAIAKATVVTKGEIGVESYPSLIIAVIKDPLVILNGVSLIILLIVSLIILLIVSLIILLIVSLIKLSVVPVAGLCLHNSYHSNCE